MHTHVRSQRSSLLNFSMCGRYGVELIGTKKGLRLVTCHRCHRMAGRDSYTENRLRRLYAQLPEHRLYILHHLHEVQRFMAEAVRFNQDQKWVLLKNVLAYKRNFLACDHLWLQEVPEAILNKLEMIRQNREPEPLLVFSARCGIYQGKYQNKHRATKYGLELVDGPTEVLRAHCIEDFKFYDFCLYTQTLHQGKATHEKRQRESDPCALQGR